MNKKYLLYSILIVGALVAGALYISHEPPLPPFQGVIKDEHLLKAPKEKILESKEVDWIELKKDGQGKSIFINHGKIVKYDYITDKKITGKFIWHKGKYTNAQIIEEKGNQRTINFYSGDHFYKDDIGDVYEIEHGATTTIEAFNEQIKVSWLEELFGKEVLAADYYSGAGDGWVRITDQATWDAAHDATIGSTVFPTEVTMNAIVYHDNDGYYIGRAFAPIDTSAISAGDTVTAATLSLYVTSITNLDNDGDDWINIVQTSQASETALVTEDYDQCGAIDNPTEGATRIDIGSLTASQYNTWTLDATGIGWIKKSGEAANCGATAGFTCLGYREGHDVIDSPLAYVDPGDRNSVYVSTSEEASTTQDPKLTVTTVAPEDVSVDSTNIIIWEE